LEVVLQGGISDDETMDARACGRGQKEQMMNTNNTLSNGSDAFAQMIQTKENIHDLP
jgi:hypothetical protein